MNSKLIKELLFLKCNTQRQIDLMGFRQKEDDTKASNVSETLTEREGREGKQHKLTSRFRDRSRRTFF